MASTTLSPSLQARKQVAGTATVAIAAIAYFAMIIVALHFLRPDHNPISQTTSEYAVGPYSFLMTSAFFSMSLASLALVIGIYQEYLSQSALRLVLLFWRYGGWAF